MKPKQQLSYHYSLVFVNFFAIVIHHVFTRQDALSRQYHNIAAMQIVLEILLLARYLSELEKDRCEQAGTVDSRQQGLSSKLKIAAIDDDFFIRGLLRSFLEEDYDFRSASCWMEFKSLTDDFHPDVLFLDLYLPDGNGIEICRDLKKQKRFENLYIMMLTGSDDKETIIDAYSAGADDFIRKPFVTYEVKSKIANLERLTRYQNAILNEYRHQSVLNRKLFNLSRIIKDHLLTADRDELIAAIDRFNGIMDIAALEVVIDDGGRTETTLSRRFDEKFVPVPADSLSRKLAAFRDREDFMHFCRIQTAGRREVFCCITPLIFNLRSRAYIIIQKRAPFEMEDKKILSLIVDFFNIMLDRIDIQSTLAKQNNRYRREITNARKIQVALLPEFKELTKFDIAYTFLPAEDISGDFFDGFYLDERTYQIIICDVSGHGVASSYIGSQMRTLFRTFSTPGTPPAEILSVVNNSLWKDLSHIYYFGTVAICQIDIESGAIRLASGGHPPLFYFDGATGNITLINNTGPLVGIIKDSRYRDIDITLNQGDALFLYTDGVTEAQPAGSHQMYGQQRLLDNFQRLIDLTSADIINTLIGSLHEFTGYADQEDDITMICIKTVVERGRA